jgi:hypothetical protein
MGGRALEYRIATKNDLPGILALYRHLQPDERPLGLDAASGIWEGIEANAKRSEAHEFYRSLGFDERSKAGFCLALD